MPTPAPAMPPLPQDVEQFLTWMTDQKGFSPATISAYRTDLLQFEEWLHREQHSGSPGPESWKNTTFRTIPRIFFMKAKPAVPLAASFRPCARCSGIS